MIQWLLLVLIGGGYAVVIAWTWWLNVEALPAKARVLVESVAVIAVSLVLGVIAAARLHGRRAAGKSTSATRASQGGTGRSMCRWISGMIVGPIATVLFLSGLYATFRFEGTRSVPLGLLLLLTGGVGFVAYVGCARKQAMDDGSGSV